MNQSGEFDFQNALVHEFQLMEQHSWKILNEYQLRLNNLSEQVHETSRVQSRGAF